MLILGIDDAGRGPVIGPMVLAGCLMESSMEEEWKNLGITDSKQLTRTKRQELRQGILLGALAHHITLTTPKEIYSQLLSGINLNSIEALKTAEIINKINSYTSWNKEKIQVIVDCPSTNTTAWKRELERYVIKKENLTILCEHKADQNYVACSAASILAKTTRDQEIENLKIKIGIDFGSGYPSDPLTIKFLDQHLENFRNQDIFRETWATIKDKDAQKAQKKLMEF